MNIQSSILCVFYILLLITHSFTLCQKDFHRNLISIFSFALFTETISSVLFTVHQVVLSYGQHLTGIMSIDLTPIYNIQYFAQLIHITAINFLTLFLLIVAKGWPITRRDMPYKYAFAIFWLLCLAADLITFYWTTITLLAKSLADTYGNATIIKVFETSTTFDPTETISTPTPESTIFTDPVAEITTAKPVNSLIDSLTSDTEQFNSTPRRLSLLLRIIIMIYFLLELRTTMILEQEKKKLQFYLHFGALTMVWFVHSIIVYVISLRVEIVWQSKLISGFSSAANFLAFAVTTQLLWPTSSRSYLFRKQKRKPAGTGNNSELDNLSNSDRDLEDPDDYEEDEYDGLEMRDLSGGNKRAKHDNNNLASSLLSVDSGRIPQILVEHAAQIAADQIEKLD